MQMIIETSGYIRSIYEEAIDVRALGAAAIQRASHVEPDSSGRWIVNLSPIGGPLLGPFDLRSVALEAERAWLEHHWLV